MFGVNSVSVSGGCKIDQQSILIQLKNELHFSSSLSTKLVSWDPNAGDCCTWAGVSCSITGQIFGLDLSNETIFGGIDGSSALFGLENLQILNLAANNFNFTQIPSRFGSLTSLRIMNLSNSGFSGQIPGELSRLTKLEVLDLSSLFSGIHSLKLDKPNLAMIVENLTQLRVLYLDGVNISSQKSDWCQVLSSSVTHLEVLSDFPVNGSLRSLALSNTNLSGPIPESIGNLKSLSHIELPNSKFSGVIPNSMANLTQLLYLDLSSNNFTGQIPSFQLCKKLTHIDLSRNRLSGIIPFAHFQDLQNLVSVNVSLSGIIPFTHRKDPQNHMQCYLPKSS